MLRWLQGTFWPRLRRAVNNWFEDYGSMMAAATAYYAALSIFPILLLLIAILGYVLRFSQTAQGAKAQLLQLVADNTSPQVSNHVADTLSSVQTSASIGGPAGLAVLIVTAIAVFSQVDTAMDRIWGLQGTGKPGVVATIRRLIFQRLRAFLMLCALGLVVIVLFFAGMTLSAMRPYTDNWLGGPVWIIVQSATSIVMYWLVFTTLYWTLPKAPVRWFEASSGAVIAAVLWEVSRQLLAAMLVGERYSAYGVVGSLIVLMLWIYFAASVIYFGAEYVQVVCQDCGTSERGVKGEHVAIHDA